jgi:hypothetical protein
VPARPLLTARVQKVGAKLCVARVLTPWGKGCTDTPDARYKLLVEVDLLAHVHPAFHPRPTYYNVQASKMLVLSQRIFLMVRNSLLIGLSSMLDSLLSYIFCISLIQEANETTCDFQFTTMDQVSHILDSALTIEEYEHNTLSPFEAAQNIWRRGTDMCLKNGMNTQLCDSLCVNFSMG